MASFNLPITPHLDGICQTLKESKSRFLVLTAATGAGKSTALPLALLSHFNNEILMLEPRRIAALAVASRLAQGLDEEPGGTVGYVMHLDKKVSSGTRCTVMTEAVLTRRLLEDPSLEGVSVVVLDEFHERSIHADIALAFLKEAMSLNDELHVIVMSATIDTKRLSGYLGADGEAAPVYSVPGRLFPVQTEYLGSIPPERAVVRELESGGKGSILVFLPGIRDIRETERALQSLLHEHSLSADIMVLHSSVSLDEQRKVLQPPSLNSPRRVILSSAIAETSLTVPDVTVVIDSGLARLNRLVVSTGMETLVTERESLFSAEQRKGRAGRVQAGKCLRLWNETEQLPLSTPPEILRTDILSLVLDCADWGVSDRTKLDWLDCPSASAWDAGRQLLRHLGCIDNDGVMTDLGRAAIRMGLGVRLSCCALAGAGNALLPYTSYADSPSAVQKRFLEDIQWRRASCFASYPKLPEMLAETKVVPLLAGFPDRLAHRTDEAAYQFPSGRIAVLPKEVRDSTSGFPEWILAPSVDAGAQTGRIYRWEEVPAGVAEAFLEKRSQTYTKASFAGDGTTLQKMQYTAYGKLILSQKRIPASKDDYAQAVCTAVEENGLDFLPLGKAAEDFLLRSEFYRQHTTETAVAEPLRETLAASVETWLLPFITGTSLSPQAVLDALRYALDGAAVDAGAPERLTLPNGKTVKLMYERTPSKDFPGQSRVRAVLEIIIQRIFGCFETPRVMGEKVLLRLLSPARRPLQITDDLEGFWNGAWIEICKEMKGRYPKHNWNYRVADRDDA